MATVLFAVVIALALGHLVPDLARFRRFEWAGDWVVVATRWFGRLEGWPGAVGAALVLGLPVLAMLAVQLMARDVAYGLLPLLLGVAVLYWCWGPRDLDLDVDAVSSAPDAPRRAAALESLAQDAGSPPGRGAALVDLVFRAALARWFGVLFWFVVLGPAGALLFRLARVLARGGPGAALPEGQRAALERVVQWLDWPAAQLMTLGLAIAADFDAVVRAWREFHAARGSVLQTDVGFLLAAGRATVDADLDGGDAYVDDTRVPLAEMQEALALCWRILLVWGVVFALLVLAGKIT
jgi:AmpE protein